MALAEMASSRRIMVDLVYRFGFFWKGKRIAGYRIKFPPASRRKQAGKASPNYLAGAWYVGAGAGALGQQEAAKRAATAVMTASLISFIVGQVVLVVVRGRASCPNAGSRLSAGAGAARQNSGSPILVHAG